MSKVFGKEDIDQKKAAIFADFARLKLKDKSFRVNFEQMRPIYLFYLPDFEAGTAEHIVDDVYKRLPEIDPLQPSRKRKCFHVSV